LLPKSAEARDDSRAWRISSERFATLANRSGKSGDGIRMPMAVDFPAFSPERFENLSRAILEALGKPLKASLMAPVVDIRAI
jgi:hypothetical protein